METLNIFIKERRKVSPNDILWQDNDEIRSKLPNNSTCIKAT